jgi:tRNA nucleotidyltransferase/poly(A) polymerase
MPFRIETRAESLVGFDFARKLAQQQEIAEKLFEYVRADPAAITALNALALYGEVYAVGGAPRDVILGKSPKDIDMMAQIDPEVIVEVLDKIDGGKLDFTGKQFGVFRFNYGGSEVEIALPRTETSTGSGHKDFDVRADYTLSVDDDLPRRDFTGNAIAVNLKSGAVIDPLGGVPDLLEGRLKHTNPNAFKEDPLRTVRAIVMNAKHNLELDPDTAELVRDSAYLVAELPTDRIYPELDKIIKGMSPDKAIKLANELGVLEQFLPEVSGTFGFDQQNLHHQHDLGTHLMEVLSGTSQETDDPDVRMAALMHDIGKPASQWIDPNTGGAHYYKGPEGQGADHAEVGADMTQDALRRLRFPNERIDRVQHLVRNHMFPDFDTPKGARKFLNRVGGPENARDLLTLRRADQEGKGTHKKRPITVDQMRGLVDEASQTPFNVKSLAINGNDLMQMGMKPGPEIGQLLNYLLQQVMDRPELNERQTLLSMASQYIR